MKITKRQLRRIIKEERARLLKEFGSEEFGRQTKEFEPIPGIDDANQSALLEKEYFDLEDTIVVPVRELIRKGYSKEEVVEALTLIVQGAL